MYLRTVFRRYYEMVVYAFPLALFYYLFIDYFRIVRDLVAEPINDLAGKSGPLLAKSCNG